MLTVQRSVIVHAWDPAAIKRDRADHVFGTIDPPQAFPTWAGVRLAVHGSCFLGRGQGCSLRTAGSSGGVCLWL